MERGQALIGQRRRIIPLAFTVVEADTAKQEFTVSYGNGSSGILTFAYVEDLTEQIKED